MADIAETIKEMIPGCEVGQWYFTGTKAAQNDTVTFSDLRVVYGGVGFVDAGGDWSAETFTRIDATANQLKMTGVATGTVYGWVIGVR